MLDGAIRAKGEIRRQIRRNRGRYLWTFTFADAHYDFLQVAAAVAHFQVQLRLIFGHVWFLLVPEPHPGGHGWHLHGATNRFLEILDVQRAWGKGWVWVGDHRRQNKTLPTRELASYLAKYATKVLQEGALHGCQPRPKGSHRYFVTQGFEPQKVTKYFRTFKAALLWVWKNYGVSDYEADLPGDRDIPVEGVWMTFPDSCCRRLKPDP